MTFDHRAVCLLLKVSIKIRWTLKAWMFRSASMRALSDREGEWDLGLVWRLIGVGSTVTIVKREREKLQEKT
jgi:hypothetical protein